MSNNQSKSMSLEQFIESSKTQYAVQKGMRASDEYVAIITPYVQQIMSLQKQLKEMQEKLPKKERVKVIKKGRK